MTGSSGGPRRPADAGPPDLTPQAAAALRTALIAAGYTVDGVADRLGASASRALARDEPAAALRATGDGSSLATLVRLFLLGRPVPATALAAALRDVPSAVLACLVEPAGNGLVRPRLDVRPYGSQWYVVSDVRRPGPLPPEHVVGVGSASLTLAGATIRRPVATALDLGTGSGVQALHLSGHAKAVTVTDTNVRALRMARLTAALSAVAPPEELAGDLYAPVAGRRFDLVVANPPFVVGSPEGRRRPYRDGDLPGDGLCRHVVRGAAAHLTAGGVAHLLVSWLSRSGDQPGERVRAWLPPGCDALVLQREVLDPAEHVGLWLRDSGDDGPAGERAAVDWLDELDRLATRLDAPLGGVAYGLVVLRRLPAGAHGAPVVRLLDVRAEPYPVSADRVAGWLDRVGLLRGRDVRDLRVRPADGLQLRSVAVPGDGWEPTEHRLIAPGALPQQVPVDAATAALVVGCACGPVTVPGPPLGAIVDVLAAAFEEPALANAAGPARRLVEAGFLEPETARPETAEPETAGPAAGPPAADTSDPG